MFNQVATEPWMANWRRFRAVLICESEHLELLRFNTFICDRLCEIICDLERRIYLRMYITACMKGDKTMWANESVFYQIYPLGFCGAPFEDRKSVV